MSIENLKTMKDQLMACTQAQLGDISSVDAHELGEAVDMIKDLAEAIYYCTITESMEKSNEKEQQQPQEVRTVNYYTAPMYRNYDSGMPMYYPSGGGNSGGSYGGGGSGGSNNYMYYPTGRNGETTYGGNMDSVGMLGNRNRNYYTEMPEMMRDPREGRSPMRRRMYMEGKEMKNDTKSQLHELEAYLQELSTDITEMIKDASPEERATLHQKMSMLANKIA